MNYKERILSGSQELFFKYGIKGITMDDIAHHLSISKKTLYRFFGDKDRILNQLTKVYLKKKTCSFEDIVSTSKDSVHEMMQLMGHSSEMFRMINPKLFYDLQKYYPAAWLQFREFKQNCILAVVEKNIRQGMKEGLYREDLNASILARLRVEEVEMAMNPDIFAPASFDLADVRLGLLDHFLHGITTRKGQKLIEKYTSTLNHKTVL